MGKAEFEWDPKKNEKNIKKHGVSFFDAQQAFLDPSRIIAEDLEHSSIEKRYYCFGEVNEAVYLNYLKNWPRDGIESCQKSTTAGFVNNPVLFNTGLFTIVDFWRFEPVPWPIFEVI